VGLIGDLLCKLRAQTTFDSDQVAASKLRGPESKTNNPHGCTRKRTGGSVPLREGFLRFLRLPSRFQVYGLKITSQD
jgi:hypothetical protein